MKFVIILSLLAFACKSCNEKVMSPAESFDTVFINVKQQELIEYDTTIDNFLGAVKIIDSTKYHVISELFSDSTGFNIYHRYQALDNYKGNDTLKLRSERINDTSNEIISIKNITVVLSVE